jgi:hypothetical protein
LGPNIKVFSDSDAEIGVSFVRSRFHFGIDRNYLLRYANLVVEERSRDFRRLLPDIVKETLQKISFTSLVERQAYVVGICKMFSKRRP